jgi:hypothetical protein
MTMERITPAGVKDEHANVNFLQLLDDVVIVRDLRQLAKVANNGHEFNVWTGFNHLSDFIIHFLLVSPKNAYVEPLLGKVLAVSKSNPVRTPSYHSVSLPADFVSI